MCGIVVEYRKKGGPSSALAMLSAIAHRGNDAVVLEQSKKWTIGYRRLAITERNNKPSFDGWRVFLNGEIYNYRELGYSGSEVEVLSKGFADHGVEFVKRLNGMFFIVAVNGEDVYCFRDRYGIKPAYWYENDNVLLVASEAKAIAAHPEYRFYLNENAKRQWFVFNNVLTDETLFGGIRKIEKGTVCDLRRMIATKYWNWEFKPSEPGDFEAAKKEVRRLVIRAVMRQLPREVSYASCLSGGVDSNIIAAILPNVQTYTAGFLGTNDETELAKKSGCRNIVVEFDRVRFLRESIYFLEDLRVGASWSNYGLYGVVAKDGYKVLFDGAGSDELFGGYNWRYSAEDYYKVVNRTGVKDQYCEDLFKRIYMVDSLEQRYLFDATHFLEGVLSVVDKMSMAHTIETRVPFLDNDLVDYCLTLPNEWKQGKFILKKAFEEFVNPEILWGPKRGFSSPDWIPGEGNQALKWATAAFNEWEKIYNR